MNTDCIATSEPLKVYHTGVNCRVDAKKCIKLPFFRIRFRKPLIFGLLRHFSA